MSGSPKERGSDDAECGVFCDFTIRKIVPNATDQFSVAACHDPETVWEVCKKDGDRQTMTRVCSPITSIPEKLTGDAQCLIEILGSF